MRPYFTDDSTTLYHGDAATVLATLPDGSADCIVTSPPYLGLRDYGVAGQIGAESSPAEYVAALVAVFREARRVLVDDGTLWLNLGDSYDSAKNLLGIPWRVAFALQDDGWILRNDIIWHKSNAMPESVTDRLSNRHEHLFMLSKSQRYWFDLDPIREPPPALAERCVRAGCKPGGTVLDPFSGSGTTGLAAARHGRRYVGIDLNREYLDLSLRTRLAQPSLITEATA